MNSIKFFFSSLFFAAIAFGPTAFGAEPFGNNSGSGFGNNSGSGFGNNPGGGQQLENPIQFDTISELIAAILDIVVKIGAPLVVFFLIYVGFLFVTARGNVTQLETAKRALVYALIGGFILLGAELLSQVIGSTVNEITGF